MAPRLILMAAFFVMSNAAYSFNFVQQCIDADTDVRAAIYFNWQGPVPPEFPSDCDAGYRQLRELKHIELNYSNRISFIAEFNQLESLTIQNSHLKSLAPLATLKNLQSLQIDGGQYYLLRPLAHLPMLTMLTLDHNARIQDLTELQGVNQLTHLRLRHNQIRSLYPVQFLQHLVQLDIDDNQVNDLTPLYHLQALSYVNVNHNQLSQSDCLTQLYGHPNKEAWCASIK